MDLAHGSRLLWRMRSVLTCVLLAVVLGACDDPAPTIVDAAGVDGSADGSADVDAGLACATLDPATCRATAGCVADFCDSCTCTPTFVACRAESASMTACPVIECPTLPPACCRADGDCKGAFCATPDDPPGCGICRQVKSSCAVDLDCRATALGGGGVPICEPVACACSPASECVPGCTSDTECATGETCEVAEGRCRPQACGASAACPPDFDCGASGCARRTCVDDAECDGFCVEGACRPALGECSLPPA